MLCTIGIICVALAGIDCTPECDELSHVNTLSTCARWKQFPIRVSIMDDVIPKVILQEAILVWNNSAGQQLFVVSTSSIADVTISAADADVREEMSGSDSVATGIPYTKHTEQCTYITGYVYVLIPEFGSQSMLGQRLIMSHELGHILGLAHDAPSTISLMTHQPSWCPPARAHIDWIQKRMPSHRSW